MKKIALHGSFSPNMVDCLQKKCPEGFEVYQISKDTEAADLAAADYIVNRGAVVNEEVVAAARNTKLIHKWGAGYDKIDVKAAGAHGIPVAICVGGNAMPVAELTVALMMAVLRNIQPMAERLKKGDWSRNDYAGRSFLLHGRTVGLLGIGNIAKKVAAIVRGGFDCPVLYYDVFRLSAEHEAALGVTYVSLDELLRQADILSIHVPLLDSTAGMIDKEKLSLMKPSAFVINTARGGIINEPDLIAALQNGTIAGAGLDTYASEPLSQDSPLLAMDNVVTTPHCGGNTVDNDINMAAICMEDIAAYDATKDAAMRCIVNREFLK